MSSPRRCQETLRRGGHDLVPDGAGGYFITTGMCLVHFDPDLGEMSGGHAGRETLPNGEFRLVERLKNIKAYSPDATWGNAYTTVRTVWWTDRIIVKKGDEERVIGPYPGAKFYKARWMKSLVVSPPSALGPLRPLRGSRFALSQPDAFGAGESRTGM